MKHDLLVGDFPLLLLGVTLNRGPRRVSPVMDPLDNDVVRLDGES